MEYNFRDIEKKWQQYWKDTNAYKVNNDSAKPKYYVLDMFPYPSGAGLHVGHPLGYIASDIFARFKRLKGYNVLHPMGYDAFGLPAEQYAIEKGVHPAISTEQNIQNFRKQLDNIGFCFDWDREVRTSDPSYYKWTQWIFLLLFKSFFNHHTSRADSIDTLVASFEKEGNAVHQFPSSANYQPAHFTAKDWNGFTQFQQQDILMHYRLAYCGIGEVNWCEALGTVLANDEVLNGVSERGGYPVVKKKLRQWYLRITEYADRLLQGLETVDFSDAMKEMQSNWIGKSSGAEMEFPIAGHNQKLRVYTTRPDTIFGVDFMVVAPELDWVKDVVSAEQQTAFEEYITYVKSRSERERMAEKKITGCFTGAYAVNPFDGREIPIWISEYVLAGYGTGAIMAVPCGDERDFKFAKHFNIPVTNIIGKHFNGEEANPTKDALLENSGFLNGMVMRQAINVVCSKIEELGIGKRKVNYKMRDAAFSRQRYWGEPFPIKWIDGIAYPLDESELPLELPHVDKYGPGPEGEGPLANIPEWTLIPNPSPQVEKGAAKNVEKKEAKGAANVPKYKVLTPMQYELAKNMRKGHTEAEKVLWEQLRDSKPGAKFRRQHPIDAYIVDFIALQERLIVEVDGGYHEDTNQKEYDENRTKILNEIGFTVIRFTNEEVLANVYAIRDEIKDILSKAKIISNTLSEGSAFAAPLSTRGEGLGVRETNTMPGYAGSSWYFLRYMDPHNNEVFCDRKASDYWGQVDLYIGGTEHAVGHLLYSRLWTKVLYDLGHIGHDEPYKKLVNQGMIQGSSRFVYRLNLNYSYIAQEIEIKTVPQFFISKKLYDDYFDENHETSNNILNEVHKRIGGGIGAFFGGEPTPIHVDVNMVDGVVLDIEAFKKWKLDFADAEFILEDGSIYSSESKVQTSSYICGSEVEKMSKSKYNTVNPDDLVVKYGADTFRMYEMFLGPVEQSKPWDTKGIEGVHRFLRKLWRMFYDDVKGKVWTDTKPTNAELKVLHKAIKKIEDDTERFSFNTAVSAFMVCVNELTDLKCNKKEILEPLLIMLTPYAPHIAEELYQAINGTAASVLDAAFPTFEAKYLVESSKEYPISINGKLRTTINMPLGLSKDEVKETVLANEIVAKWVEGKEVKNLIYVPNKMVNVVI
jgi:leucyl-tRNA synthetase